MRQERALTLHTGQHERQKKASTPTSTSSPCASVSRCMTCRWCVVSLVSGALPLRRCFPSTARKSARMQHFSACTPSHHLHGGTSLQYLTRLDPSTVERSAAELGAAHPPIALLSHNLSNTTRNACEDSSSERCRLRLAPHAALWLTVIALRHVNTALGHRNLVGTLAAEAPREPTIELLTQHLTRQRPPQSRQRPPQVTTAPLTWVRCVAYSHSLGTPAFCACVVRQDTPPLLRRTSRSPAGRLLRPKPAFASATNWFRW